MVDPRRAQCSSARSRTLERVALATELGEPELAAANSQPEPSAVECALETWFGSDVPFAGRLFGEVMSNAYGQSQFASRPLYGRQSARRSRTDPLPRPERVRRKRAPCRRKRACRSSGTWVAGMRPISSSPVGTLDSW